MNIRLIPTSIEIYFWSVVISLLSDSEVFQHVVRMLHGWATTGQMGRYLRVALWISSFGFLMGIILGIAGA
jgi:hypothetical protein